MIRPPDFSTLAAPWRSRVRCWLGRRWAIWGSLMGQFAILLAGVVFLALGQPAAVWAAESPATPPSDGVPPLEAAPNPGSLQPDANDVPSETINQFVQAYLAVVDLIESREADLQRAETEAESFQLQQDIQAQAFELIESAGLTRQQYWQLLGLANADPDFRDRVLAQVEEASL